ncbi:MAG: hypothetical protein JSS89_06055 [Bacteroidetes bacterium]|nr:hypothetical protein [Bacteroidota bacterium]
MIRIKFDEQIFAWWWLPDFPDDKVPGYVSFSSGKTVVVHILGMFDSVVNWKQGAPLVYGRDTRNGLYTLTDVSFSGQLEPLEKSYQVVELHSNLAFAGVHVPNHDPQISEIFFTPTGLNEWASSDEGIDFSLAEDKTAWLARIPVNRESMTCEIDDECKLSLEYVRWASHTFDDSCPVEHSCHCRITFTSPTTIEKCFRLMKVFCDFISFSTRIMSGFDSYSAKVLSDLELNTAPGNEDNRIIVLGLNSAVKASSEKRMYGQGGRNYFTLKHIEDTFQVTLKSWYDAATKYETAYHLYFAIASRKRATYIDHEFFTYVQSLEGFYGKDNDRVRFLSPGEYRKLLNDVIYPFIVQNTNTGGLAEAMRDKLQLANRWTLREQLREILLRRTDDFVQTWIPNPDPEAWISYVVASRDNFIHVLDKPDTGVSLGWQYFVKTLIALRLLVEAHLLEVIGFPKEEVDRILNTTYKSEDSIAT